MLLLLVAARMQALQLVEAALQPKFCYYLSSELAPPATTIIRSKYVHIRTEDNRNATGATGAIVEAASDRKSVEKFSTNARCNCHD
jgi:hypothetical protein